MPSHIARKIKEGFKALEDENARLREENEALKQKVSDLESAVSYTHLTLPTN